MADVDGLVEEHSLDELKGMADERGLPTSGTKQQVAQRIVDHDDEHDKDLDGLVDPQPDEPEADDEPEPEPEPETDEPEPKPEPKRAGGYVDHDDGRGWVLEPEPEPQGGPPAPVEAGPGGLPGNPVMSAAGWSLPKDE
jgi:hypothetical protein